jgi:hypothetical protein
MAELDDRRLSRPNTGAGRMQRLVLGVLLEHEAAGELPTSGRFVFYELEGRGWSGSPRGASSVEGPPTAPASRKSSTR